MHRGLIESRRAFSDLDFWPPQRSEINPEGWLAQFDPDDRAIAEELLESFVFFNQRHTEQLFTSAFLSLSGVSYDGPYPRAAWKAYRDTVLVSFPGSEDQNPTDSGHGFARLARKKFSLPQPNIYRPADLVGHLRGRSDPVAVLFVDDILGSGDQFLDCWRELIYVGDAGTSLEQELERLDARVDFVVAVATSTGVAELKEHAPRVTVAAGSLLDPQASARHPHTRVVTDHPPNDLALFLEKYADRAGYPSDEMWGHKSLATTVAFEHGVPDTTLPIFWHADNWIPLRRQS
ncbi:phosphoribosyltransferase-like protein [Microbacterium aurantiacum]|uniref:phosphoribosyltransferase-like protein n=1 Tax=Microbacterium aurantiacum TaxID=162393 RepID=UPI003D749575